MNYRISPSIRHFFKYRLERMGRLIIGSLRRNIVICLLKARIVKQEETATARQPLYNTPIAKQWPGKRQVSLETDALVITEEWLEEVLNDRSVKRLYNDI
jgi:hypothetical protein